MSENIIEELLTKHGYSKFALDSEIVTEDMLDDMLPQFAICTTPKFFENNNGHGQCIMVQADGNKFDNKSTLVK